MQRGSRLRWLRPPCARTTGAALQEHLAAAGTWAAPGHPEEEEEEEDPGKSGWSAEREETAGDRSCPRADATGRLAFVEWEEAPRRGLLNRGLFPALSLLGYETPGKVDGCHGVMYAPPAVKEVYCWERVHTSSIPSA